MGKTIFRPEKSCTIFLNYIFKIINYRKLWNLKINLIRFLPKLKRTLILIYFIPFLILQKFINHYKKKRRPINFINRLQKIRIMLVMKNLLLFLELTRSLNIPRFLQMINNLKKLLVFNRKVSIFLRKYMVNRIKIIINPYKT